ncbi:tripartite tricarboxylate transporter substrate binding protein [Corticibacterium sp. UT-5YL-CI-8]|nr:tripartite tricarboxylate transporter substrate binding protein [Tianweitania sp. UT-5YL-CI-8]
MDRRQFLRLSMASGLAAGGLGIPAAHALEGYPSGNLTMIVPYPPGGIADSRGRLMADWLAKAYGKSCLVENVPGAAGVVGANRVKDSPNDGRTLISTTSGAMVVVPQLSKLDYPPLDVLAPVSNCFINPVAVIVAKNGPYKTIQDIIDHAKKRPGELTFGSPGANSLYHLTGEAINVLAGVKMIHVPYKSAGQYTIDMISGRISFAIGTLGTVMGAKEEVRGVMLGSAKRSSLAPGIPSAPEVGLPDLIMPDGAGLLMHINTPKEIVDEVSSQMGTMASDPETLKTAEKLGVEIDYAPADEYRERLKTQHALVAKLIADAGLKPDQ